MTAVPEPRAAAVLATGALEIHGRITDSSNTTLLVTARLDPDELLAVYKPERGERPLWDFPPGLWRREVAAYELDRLLGTDCVPLTVARDDPDYGRGSVQLWVHEDGVEHYLTLRGRPQFADWFRALAAFDVVANNTDRKSGHVLLEEGRCWAIDNGLRFHVDDKLRTVVWDHAGEPVAPELVGRLAAVAAGDVEVLRGLLAPEEVDATQRRARELAEAGVLPEPVEDGRYPRGPGRSCESAGRPAHAEAADGVRAVAGELATEVERRDRRRAQPRASSRRSAGTIQQTSNSMPSGSFA